MATHRKLAPTPEATIGPFYPGPFVEQFPHDLTQVAPLVVHRPRGQPITVTMHFLDAAGKPVPSAIVEVWQANAAGRYRHPQDGSESPLDPQFDGFARLRTDENGACTLATIKPGAHRVGAMMRAPHLRLTIFASGIDRLNTQVFLEGEALNEGDPVLTAIADPGIRQRLIARRTQAADHDGVLAYDLTIVMRGTEETPFFDDLEDCDG